jgi:DNA-binding NtrC family response regulator
MSETIRVLVVDDEERFRTTLAKLLKLKGLNVAAAGDAAEALALMQQASPPYDVVLLDVRMPGMDGIDALREMKKIDPEVEVIILTGHASVDAAAEIMKRGGFDFLLKPCPADELHAKVLTAYERKMTRKGK